MCNVSAFLKQRFFSDENYRYRAWLFLIILFATVLRLPLFYYFDVLTPDGVIFIEMAKTMRNGEYFHVNVPIHHHHPFYPAFVYLFSGITSFDYVKSGQIVSLLAALTTIVFVYKLSAFIYNKTIGLCSAFIMSIVPLHVFYSVSVLKDSLYVFMVLIVVYYAVKALKYQHKGCFLIMGLFLGFSYLTRFDGILLLLLIPVLYYVIDLKDLPGKKHYILLSLKIAGCVYVCYGAVLFFQTGEVTISKKFNYYVNPIFATSAAKEKLVNNFGEEEARKVINTNTQLKSFLIKRVEGLYRNIHSNLSYDFPILLMLLAGMGIAGYTFGKYELLLCMTPLIYLFLFPFLKYADSYRHMLCITPFLSIFAGKGFFFLQQKLSRKNFLLKIIPLVFFLIIFIPLVFSPILNGTTYRDLLLDKKVGLFLARQIDEKNKIPNVMSTSSVIAFYAKSKHIPLTASMNTNEVFEQISKKNVDFFIAEDKFLEEFYEITNLDEMRTFKIDKIYEYTDTLNRKMNVLKILPTF